MSCSWLHFSTCCVFQDVWAHELCVIKKTGYALSCNYYICRMTSIYLKIKCGYHRIAIRPLSDSGSSKSHSQIKTRGHGYVLITARVLYDKQYLRQRVNYKDWRHFTICSRSMKNHKFISLLCPAPVLRTRLLLFRTGWIALGSSVHVYAQQWRIQDFIKGVQKPRSSLTKGVWGHAPPEKFRYFGSSEVNFGSYRLLG